MKSQEQQQVEEIYEAYNQGVTDTKKFMIEVAIILLPLIITASVLVGIYLPKAK